MQQPAVDREQTTIARMAAGDADALSELYAQHRTPLLAYLRLLTRDAGLAEETLQDTLLAAWHGAERFAGRASVRAWLFGIARRRAHDALRQRSLRLVFDEAMAETAAADPEPEALAIAAAERDELVDAIGRLSPVHREILLLTFMHELSYRELADVLGVPLGTVQSRLCHARRALAAQLRAFEDAR